jgi:hypothetical protein
MKTNSSARWIVRIRVCTLCLIIVAIAGIEFGMCQSLANRVGRVSFGQAESSQVPNVSIGDLMVAAR